jgi:hypothetical protein
MARSYAIQYKKCLLQLLQFCVFLQILPRATHAQRISAYLEQLIDIAAPAFGIQKKI